jgi:hypothetical protein
LYITVLPEDAALICTAFIGIAANIITTATNIEKNPFLVIEFSSCNFLSFPILTVAETACFVMPVFQAGI